MTKPIDRPYGGIMDDLDHDYRLAQEKPGGGAVVRDLAAIEEGLRSAQTALATSASTIAKLTAALERFAGLAIEFPTTDPTHHPIPGSALTFADFQRARDLTRTARLDLAPADLQLLAQLKRDNRHDGSRPVIEGDGEAWAQAIRLSDLGLIAIEQIARGGVLHITRLGSSLFRRALGEVPAAAEPQLCAHTGLPCVPGCDGKTACAGMHIPLNQWPVAEEEA